MNVPPPVRPVWNGGTPSAHSWRCRATVSAREYSCGEAAFYQPFPYSPVDGFLVTLVPVRLRRFERPDWSSPFCSIATAFSIFWGKMCIRDREYMPPSPAPEGSRPLPPRREPPRATGREEPGKALGCFPYTETPRRNKTNRRKEKFPATDKRESPQP